MSSIQRVTGSSGFDVEGTVQKLMAGRRIPLDKMGQKKQTVQWNLDAYREMNTRLTDYRNNKLSNLRLESAYSAKKVDVSGATDVITATASPSTQTGTLTIGVTLLATAATNKSAVSIKGTAFDANVAISSTTLAGYDPTSASRDFTINGKSFTVKSTDTLTDVLNNINKNSDVSAYFDAASGKVAFMAKNTGVVNDPTNAASQANPADPNSVKGELITFFGDFLTKGLQVTTASGTAAKDAQVTINGLDTTSHSNSLNVNGVNIILQKAGVANLNVKTDSDAIVNSVKTFINDYNDLIKTLKDKISEPKYKGYQPLTDDQRKNMKDTDITNWEAKAKSGLLNSDSILTGVLRDMRSDIMQTVNIGGTATSITSLGITTGTYQENGKLYLDETKLRAAIDQNPDIVKNVFAQTGTDTVNRTDTGVAKRMYDDVQKALTAFTGKIGSSFSSINSTLGKQLSQLTSDIATANTRMTTIEDNYYKQFSAMETAMSKANSQSSWLTQQFK